MKQTFVTSLYEKYAVELKRFISAKFHSVGETEDIVQDTFHNILGVEDLERISNPRAYLYQTAQNVALNRLRKRNRHEAYQQLEHSDELTPPPEFGLQAQRDLTKLEESVNKLPAKWKRAFLLSRVEHKSYKEIAQTLNISVSTVEKHLMGALHRLNQDLDRK
ncbi:MAG: sigma-70 family RNA polymerase sigma factor [Cellvibrionaceae bacterium]